jgi:small subunit ribosomal protein S10
MATNKIRIILKSYDAGLVDEGTKRIVEVCRKTNTRTVGPVPMPTRREIVTVIRSPHKYKDSREQFELLTHKRIVDAISPSPKAMEMLTKTELPAGVDIKIKLN